MNRSARFLIATLFSALFSVAALAQESGPYLGAALGQSKFKEWCDPTLAACDAKDSTWKLFGGYRFNRYFAVEGSYLDWGEVTATGASGARVAADQRSYGIAAVGTVHLMPQFAVFGRFGYVRTEQETKRITPNPLTVDREDTEVHYGLGARYALSRNWGVRAEWENTAKLKVRMLSLGVEYSFSPVLIPDTISYAGLYVGGSVGQMKAGGDCPAGFSCDLKDTGWKVFGGYQLHRNFAVEATYGDWGDITLSTRVGSTTVTGTGEISSWGIAGLGILPVATRVSLFGKAGIVVTEQEVGAFGGGITTTETNDGTEFHWGFGATFNITDRLRLRAEWERLHKSEVDFMSLGVQYSF